MLCLRLMSFSGTKQLSFDKFDVLFNGIYGSLFLPLKFFFRSLIILTLLSNFVQWWKQASINIAARTRMKKSVIFLLTILLLLCP